MLVPSLVPSVPAARSPAAWALLAVGLLLLGALADPRRTHLPAHSADRRPRRRRRAAAPRERALGRPALTFTDLGWWLGHVFEFVGITLVGSSVAYDLYRAGQSRPLAGDLSASEMVAAEEAFLGARVRALMVRLAEKDSSTEEHTRRVAALAVAIGERFGFTGARLRALAIGGLLHDMGKLSIPNSILQKPGALDDAEFAIIKRHPAHGHELLAELGGFNDTVARLVLDHHERLDGSGYPRGLRADELALETRILAVCDVYDALVSPRVYRAAWTPRARARAAARRERGTAFDADCVEALVQILPPEFRRMSRPSVRVLVLPPSANAPSGCGFGFGRAGS